MYVQDIGYVKWLIFLCCMLAVVLSIWFLAQKHNSSLTLTDE